MECRKWACYALGELLSVMGEEVHISRYLNSPAFLNLTKILLDETKSTSLLSDLFLFKNISLKETVR